MSGQRMAELFRLGCATILIQLVFWFVLQPIFFGRPDLAELPRFETSNVQVATVPDLSPASVDAAQFQPIDTPGWSDCCAPGYRIVRFDFDAHNLTEAGAAILFDVGADNAQIWVNQRLVVDQGWMQLPDITYHANRRTIERVPLGIVNSGKNTAEYRLVRDSVPWFDFYPPLIGPYEAIADALEWRAFVINDLTQYYVTAGFLLSLFVFVLMVQSSSKAFAACLLALVLVWTLRTHYYLWLDPPFDGQARITYYFLLTGLLPLCWLIFVDRWTQKPIRRLAPGAVLAGVAYAAFVGVNFWPAVSEANYERASAVVSYFGPVCMALTVIRIAWHVVANSDQRYWEVGLLILLATVVILELVFQTHHYMVGTQPYLVAALLVAFFARSVRLFRSEQQINETLAQQLDQREAELASAHAREAEVQRQRALIQERKRIMRDMHDGLGSRLFGLAAWLKGKDNADSGAAANVILEVIDELRLIVDSLDTAGDDLGIALGAFRARVSPRLAAANIELDWDVDDAATDVAFSASEILDIYRILQEACTNTLRHTQASRVVVNVRRSGHGLDIVVRDDGAGFDGAQPQGHGLRNMEARAKRIGGHFSIRSNDAGTTIVISIPNVTQGLTGAPAA